MCPWKPSGHGCRTIPATTCPNFRRDSPWRNFRNESSPAQASPVGFVNQLAHKYGEHAEIDREEFFRHGLEAATGYATAFTGTAAQIADRLEEIFEATGSRGGFMVKQSQAGPREIMLNIVDHLVPELQRRGRYRKSYEGKTLRENLAV